MALDRWEPPQPRDPNLPRARINEELRSLIEGHFEEVLPTLEKKYAEHARPWLGTVLMLGQGYLHAGQLDDAKRILDEYNELPEGKKMESAYAWAGVPQWLLKNPIDACDKWKIGLECQYRDMSGGMHSPLLLYFASTTHPEAFDREKAKMLIRERAASPKSIYWPGPIGKFLLGEITEEQLREEASKMPYEPKKEKQFGMVHFYSGVLALGKGNKAKYLERMKRCADIRESKMSPEGFLAQHELAATPK
jgi:hypothetical protein